MRSPVAAKVFPVTNSHIPARSWLSPPTASAMPIIALSLNPPASAYTFRVNAGRASYHLDTPSPGIQEGPQQRGRRERKHPERGRVCNASVAVDRETRLLHLVSQPSNEEIEETHLRVMPKQAGALVAIMANVGSGSGCSCSHLERLTCFKKD
jgi:hypothetical protein